MEWTSNHVDTNAVNIEVELNVLEKLFQEPFNITDYHVGFDFLVMSEKLDDKKRMELSLWASAIELDGRLKATELELLVGIRDEDDDLDNIVNESFEIEEYAGLDACQLLEAMKEILHYEVKKMGN